MIELVHEKTEGRLPTSSFTLRDGGENIGFMQIRHRRSHSADTPPECASHVYYQISKEHRRKGYGKRLLALGIKEARRIGLAEIVVACDASNVASKKIIEANGGVFEASFQTVSGGDEILKYRIYINL